MKILNKIVAFIMLGCITFSWGACNDVLDTTPSDVVVDSLNFKNVYDADNAIWGLYGKFANLAENIVVLNELRGDLIDVTSNASSDLVAINNNTATQDNKYCDPTAFYQVIMNANLILTNFDKMLAEHKMSYEDYAPRYSDVVAVRSWTYLQLGIHFKRVPYVTKPLLDITTFSVDTAAVNMNLDELLVQLIQDMESVPTLAINTVSSYYNKTITDNNKSFFINLQFVNKHVLLGDLYLWNDRYIDAATQYKAFIDEEDVINSNTNMNNKVSGWVWAGTNEPRFQIAYQRYKDQDVSSYRNMWKEIFMRSSTDNASIGLKDEMIWMMSYSGSSKSASPFVKLFANTGIGTYQMKPSAYAIDSLWETQVQRTNGFVFDGRGRESSFDYVNGQPVVLKYLYDYYNNFTTDANKTIHLNYNSVTNPYSCSGKWFLYRAALLHLRYAEAANRAGYPKLAYALLNDGISANYDWKKSDGTLRADKEGVQYSSFAPANDNVAAVPYPDPFYLDARINNAPYMSLRGIWRDNVGIRGRAYLNNIVTPAYVHDGVNDHNDSIQWIETALIKEAALECGFEGNRWGDLLRVSRRRSKDGLGTVPALMNTAISNKFKAAEKGISTLSEDNLFLPMKH